MSYWSLMSGEEGAGERYYRIRLENDEIKKVCCETDTRSDDEIKIFLIEQLNSGKVKAFEFIYRHEGYSQGYLVDPKPSLTTNDALLLKSVFDRMNWTGLIELQEVCVGPKSNPGGTEEDYDAFMSAMEKLDNHLDSIVTR